MMVARADTSSWALQDLVLGVVPEAPEPYATLDRFSFGWDQGLNAAPLERAIDFSVGILCVGGNYPNIDARNRFNLIDLRLDHLAFIRLSRL
ncbi:hypothetical protein [Bradyrhizobium japonicum]|uniref:hypothetical protein n=1 Tax=Bradyrhizobium japonicum TaxID=375 RepID=UPI00126A2620|nr:hypothetical protein [Bradyrhizobium japonicum]